MTVNQISYARAMEDQRHNEAMEKETARANMAKEQETFRANTAGEELTRSAQAETHRSNLAREAETNRSNVARETEAVRSNMARENETIRSNVARETETHRANLVDEALASMLNDARVKEILSSIALTDAKAEAQKLSNYVVRASELNDSSAQVQYQNEYQDGLFQNPLTGVRNMLANAGDIINDLFGGFGNVIKGIGTMSGR